MLTQQDNERLTRVGPGTPGGELMRRYWQPALLLSEIAENDGEPVRVRLLGEDLIAFRDTSGAVGLVDALCSHRRAPLFFGRNEKHGLRCVYHGWKFDTAGKCVDLPNQPEGSDLKSRAGIKAYPTVECGGLLWAYLGPPELQPPPPDFEWTRAPATHLAVSKTYQACNYLQGLEGGLDTAHVSFLHHEKMGDTSNLFARDPIPKIELVETDYGFYYVSTRKMDVDTNFTRLYQYVLPAQAMRPANTATGLTTVYNRFPRFSGHIWVPIDDEQCWVINWMAGFDKDSPLDADYVEQVEKTLGRGQDDFVPGTFRLKANKANDYLIDRERQRTISFTGIQGINTQDVALQENMGAIVDRSKELLCGSDRAITSMRRILLEATRAVERGEAPKGVNTESYRLLRPHDGLVPADTDWRDSFAKAKVTHW